MLHVVNISSSKGGKIRLRRGEERDEVREWVREHKYMHRTGSMASLAFE
jgi:hypothetical protein